MDRDHQAQVNTPPKLRKVSILYPPTILYCLSSFFGREHTQHHVRGKTSAVVGRDAADFHGTSSLRKHLLQLRDRGGLIHDCGGIHAGSNLRRSERRWRDHEHTRLVPGTGHGDSGSFRY